MGPLFSEVVRQQTLLDAWHAIHADARVSGTQRAHAEEFASGAARRISDLAEQLAAGTWRPTSVKPVRIPKADGRAREIVLSALPDKIVERALLRVLDPVVDPELLPWSFAYRRGLGVSDALRAVAEARDDGAVWVARLDVRNCFASIPRRPVLTRLRDVVAEREVTELVRLLVYRVVRGQRRSSSRGLHEGSVLSPLLCNLYLDQFDRQMLALGYRVVRYADDIAIPSGTRKDAERALAAAERVFGQLGLSRNDRKDLLVDFDTGVPFLGATLTSSGSASTEGVSRPLRSSVYVVSQGALLRSKGSRVRIELRGDCLLSVPWRRVHQVMCFGRVGMTTAFLHRALHQGVDVVLLSENGRYDGALRSPFRTGAAARREQHKLSDSEGRSLDLARMFVAGKIANLRTGLLRAGRRGRLDDVARALERMRGHRRDALGVTTMAQLLGIEGSASRLYFDCWSRQLPPEWMFAGRRRRPPPDPVNAMLSFGYSVLTYEAVSAVEAAGLDPAVGFLHSSKGNRPSLALDLVEEFRPVIVDSVVTRIISSKMLTPLDFVIDEIDGKTRCLLNDPARRLFLAAYERRLLAVVSLPATGRRVSYRVALHQQALHLARVLTGADATYRPLPWK